MKMKIFNDPIYGFISISNEVVFQLIEHPYFQRLRRIRQLGMTSFVYPGALHTRFQHAMGAMHLMKQAVDTLRSKKVDISEEEEEAVLLAILLHDIGHGPFSHALEHTLVTGVHHEFISALLMKKLNDEFQGKLNLAIKIFNGEYERKFFHQMVSGQLDMDRLDYLKRDSFFTGVSEGIISTDRIIAMLNVCNDNLVVEEKGIYSVEKFIVARRLMYWQVYYHKTTVAAEQLMVSILKRAKDLSKNGHQLFATPSLSMFLANDFQEKDFIVNPDCLETFSKLDDYDIQASVKVWEESGDKILSLLSKSLNNRKLFKTVIKNEFLNKQTIQEIKQQLIHQLDITEKEANYFLIEGSIKNNAYNPDSDHIYILFKNGRTEDITKASDQLNVQVLSKTIEKQFVCFPKWVVIDKSGL